MTNSLDNKKIIELEENVSTKKVVFVEDVEPKKEENIQISIKEITPKPILKKKQISYEDILTSLNMTVVDGKLQYIDKKEQAKRLSMNRNIDNSINSPINNRGFNNMNIYNKFQQQPQQRTPLTKEQYQKLVIENRKKKFLAIQRAKQAKPTKMLFI
jgi:hypothetical protein